MATVKDLLLRTATAVVGIPLAIFFIFFQGGIYFAACATVLALIGWGEYARGTRRAGYGPVGFIGVLVLVGGIAWSAGVPFMRNSLDPHMLMFIGFLAIIAATFALRNDAPIRTAGSTVLGVSYILCTFGLLVQLRGVDMSNIPLPQFDWSDPAGHRIVYIMFVTWALDTGAYLAGKLVGGPHMAPHISPHKTIGGAFGGVVSAMIVSLAFYRYASLSIGDALALGALIGVFGQLGDLWESAMKREIGIKDFGEILPGHGGVLDRFDSLFLTAPVALFYFLYMH